MQAPIMPAMQTPVMPTQVVASEMVATQPKAVVESVETATVTNKNIKTVTSPLVGTFYSAPSPDAAPFISVGDTVKKGQVIGIVEAMKLMNEIESEQDGVVTEIMVNNGDMVEYGQVLVKVS